MRAASKLQTSFQRLGKRLACRSSNRSMAIGAEFVAKSIAGVSVGHAVHAEEHSINKPTIFISDPVDLQDLDITNTRTFNPRYTFAEMKSLIDGSIDPFALVHDDVSQLSEGIRHLLGCDHPVLAACANYFFEFDGGKKIRPTMVLLMAYALNFEKGAMVASPAQLRLAEITEMIHTASLFHDDVIDKASTRRGVQSVNRVFGNKLAILGGDFLLSRASVMLARLRNVDVVELLSTVIEHLVKGEVMQMRPLTDGRAALEYYLRKNYYKTASLMANSCQAAALLGGHDSEMQNIAYTYGKQLGMAFQLVDDVLDFEGSVQTLGKPSLADLNSGLATAPVLFAAEEHPSLVSLIERKFERPHDVDEAVAMVRNSAGLDRARALAQVMAENAIDAVEKIPPTPAREALIALACKVIIRNH